MIGSMPRTTVIPRVVKVPTVSISPIVIPRVVTVPTVTV